MEYEFEHEGKYIKRLDGVLSGQKFRLAMDNGEELDIRFVSDEIVEWRHPGERLRWEKYGCLQADEQTYFVAAILSGVEPTTCVTLVLDVENRLVTMAVSRLGYYPKRPRLVVVEYYFGAIRVPDLPLPMKRHGFTRDLVGKKLTWHYAGGFVNTHIYPSERFCRIRPLTAPRTPEEEEAMQREIREGKRKAELLYEEPTRFIKIKEGMYLISFVEEDMNRHEPQVGGNNLMILTNLALGFDCGRTFSMGKEGKLEHGFFRSRGEVTEEYIPAIEEAPSPYRMLTERKCVSAADLGIDPPVREKLPEMADGRRRYLALPDKGIAGKVFRLHMDSEEEYVVHFVTDDTLMLAKKGELFEQYSCSPMHCDDGVWFVPFMRGTECVTLVLDEAQGLVTVVYAKAYPRTMQLVKHRILFGAIEKLNEKAEFKRHSFTDDLVGKKMIWHYSPYVNITHCYFTENYMRNSLKNQPELPDDAPEEAKFDAADRIRRWGSIFFEEPAQYVRINEHLYLVCLGEAHRNRMDPLQGGGDMVFAINTLRMRDYGRGYHLEPGLPGYSLFSVYGDWDETPDEMDTAESPYRV
ncbi:MAG: MoaF N-terminal domain-containing protein [Lachnospiraceae bacterium]|nr:MoaF N-terminal domain-containing protein [Lachnospiraceae bacterium]